MAEYSIVAFAKQLNLLTLATAVVPVGVGLTRRHLPQEARCLLAYALLATLALGTLSEVGRYVWHNNILILRTETWLGTVLLAGAYYQALPLPAVRRRLPALLVSFTLLAVAETIWLMDWHRYDSPYMRVAQSVLLIGLALRYFEHLLLQLRNIRLERDPMFLVSVGVVFYYAGAISIFVLETQLTLKPDQIWVMYIVEFVLRMAFNGLLTAALWHAGQLLPQLVHSSPAAKQLLP
ncbi:hypothetical protein F0P96_11855 [Hymenobacter busanensis]|uniref:Uncharacterized protein n=1 Tax=Hymenobacter busanensis TaxID=2607656 RepID=A0A7L4ZW98_9BACT|nr:hypothetical protein [Hymenobacter busanensis]KAA9332173.1 hypothetical protein F0P96_11855 [Hymenobacter busanensis]QHJ07488.1 hypothetical protein GUY19_09415 [Hymenobacter busanensis]